MLLVAILVLSLATINIVFGVQNVGVEYIYDLDDSYNISIDSNFFGQAENQTLVDIPADPENTLLIKGYSEVAETDDLKLYVKERYFNIAVLDKNSGYIWYSVYPDYLSYGLSGTSRFFVESGVIIEYYNMDNILIEDSKSYVSGSKYNVSCEFDYEMIENGFVAHLYFEDQGIKFDVNVSIDGSNLIVHLPMDTLVEEDVEKQMLNLDGSTYMEVTQYRLKAVYLFPYFGSNNSNINGYSFIPDGSGALIRYTDTRSSTAYIERVYGSDEGISKFSESSTYYIKDELTASYPVFGVNHGYQQAAFLAVITEGDAYSEIHSYPYGYNSYQFNTTFAKFIVRERYTIQTSGNESDSFSLINSDPYPTDYTVEYHFLSGSDASYSGMANEYRDYLEIQDSGSDAGINLTLIGMDYKNGLLGKNYVEMTTYGDVSDIVSDLKSADLSDIDVVYIAWNKGGYYDNTPVSAALASNLGGSSDFKEMMNYLNDNGVDIYFYDNPIVSFDQSLGSSVVKKLTLSSFVTDAVTSSLFDRVYYRDPSSVADVILDQASKYNKLGIDSFALATVGSALFSYRYNSENHYRNEMIETLISEFEALGDYNIGLSTPNSYLWKYIDAYYDAPIESNKYAYMTDSIPFVELVLGGSVNLYSSYINYVSDYELMKLRLIEYGVNPSYLITKESTHYLRYTNSEFIYTSQYDLWKDTIVSLSKDVIDVLSEIESAQMISHRYVVSGVAEITYSNQITIYVNYTQNQVTVLPGVTVEARGYEVVRS